MGSIPQDKQQVMITLPKEIVKTIDEIAESNYIKRSQQISRIVIDYVKQLQDKEKTVD